jgi:hypothetical protein
MAKSEGLVKAKKAFNDWRAMRASRREPIPESLWRLAASLLNNHTRNVVARALRLNATTLREKAKEMSTGLSVATAELAKEGKEGDGKLTFCHARLEPITEAKVEQKQKEASSGTCFIQIRRTDGTMMDLHHPGVGKEGLAHLVRSFCG